MEKFLRDPISVSIDDLYPDPNNPRLGRNDTPGYEDVDALYDEGIRDEILGELGNSVYAVDELIDAIIGQGWMPIDSIVVWRHPDEPKRYVVLEGNRRRLALERIRTEVLPKARRKLERLLHKQHSYSPQIVREHEESVEQLAQIVADTKKLPVVPIDADSVDVLRRKLPRILAVRHITGAKDWKSFAQDLWLLRRYSDMYEVKHGEGAELDWDADLIRRVAEEASLGPTVAMRKLKASAWYSHFRADWEEELPEGDQFDREDYYLFELIARLPWVRRQLKIEDGATRIPPESGRVLFDWVFKIARPRPKDSEANPNVFYRHENLKVWDQMRRYDDDNNTNFSGRFNVDSHMEAPRMHEVEAEWVGHKARRKPVDIVSELLRRLKDVSAETLATEGEHLRKSLEELAKVSARFLKMIEATESEEG